MIEIELHSHSKNSLCGMHTHLELIHEAIALNLKGIAITDHGTTTGGPGINHIFFKRFPNTYKGVKILKGIEANILDDGNVDVPNDVLPLCDVILAGLHPNITKEQSKTFYTGLMLKTLEKNPFIDIISHPDIKNYPLDLEVIAKYCAEKNIALEFNNANILYGKTNFDHMETMAKAIIQYNTPCVLNGDAHTIVEIAKSDAVMKKLKEMNIQNIDFLNTSYEKTMAFLESRKHLKKNYK